MLLSFALSKAYELLVKPAGPLATAFHRVPITWTALWFESSRNLVFTKTIGDRRHSFSWRIDRAQAKVLEVHCHESAPDVIKGLRSYFSIPDIGILQLLMASLSVTKTKKRFPDEVNHTIEVACRLATIPGVLELLISGIGDDQIEIMEMLVEDGTEAILSPWFVTVSVLDPMTASRGLGLISQTGLLGDTSSWLAISAMAISRRPTISPRLASAYLGILSRASASILPGEHIPRIISATVDALSGDVQAEKELSRLIMERMVHGDQSEVYGLLVLARGLPNVRAVVDGMVKFRGLFDGK